MSCTKECKEITAVVEGKRRKLVPLRSRFFIRGRRALKLDKPRSVAAISIRQPLTVYIHHTADTGVHGDKRIDDSQYWRSIQRYHFSQGYNDIAYNFLVSKKLGSKKKARVYEGRGLGVLGGATYHHNHNSISICVSGNFQNNYPSQDIIVAIKKTIKRLKKLGANIVFVDVHSSVYPTSCCGKHLIRALRENGVIK